MKNINFISPPKTRWANLETEPITTNGATHLFYGIVNIGSPHQCYSSFHGKYDPNIGLLDLYGDPEEGCKPLYYLFVEPNKLIQS